MFAWNMKMIRPLASEEFANKHINLVYKMKNRKNSRYGSFYKIIFYFLIPNNPKIDLWYFVLHIFVYFIKYVSNAAKCGDLRSWLEKMKKISILSDYKNIKTLFKKPESLTENIGLKKLNWFILMKNISILLFISKSFPLTNL